MNNNRFDKIKHIAYKNLVYRSFKSLWNYNKLVIDRIVNLAEDTDVNGTITNIQGGIVLKGSNLWMLICSTMIACIGLDVNSPAVIIGAMLVSPLMGPILGLGLSVGINDKESMFLSLRNLGVATGLSLMASFVYFKISPYGYLTDEMTSRTSPTILDAFVALFGGLAGIIAGSRSNNATAVPGVAIATALMPPLCTAGYGLATGDTQIFGGAFYLFFINTVLISISTYFIVRVLKFPLMKSIDEQKAKLAKRAVYAFLFILLVPSIYFLYTSLRSLSQDKIIEKFISNNIHEDLENGVRWSIREKSDSTQSLQVYYFGDYIEEDRTRKLEASLNDIFSGSLIFNYFPNKRIALDLTPTAAPPDKQKAQMAEDIERLSGNLRSMEMKLRNEISDSLSSRIENLNVRTEKTEIIDVMNEYKVLFPEISKISYGHMTTDGQDTLGENLTYIVKWKFLNKARISRHKTKEKLESYLNVKHGAAVDVIHL
ncbi:DUF389 domain-containing protein [Aureibacter tunicatorum]|uniref:Hydrophobic protein (TIGR00271 family) n=1 Tax=Aureibacter tunicatorum TaxID=866807 RepID=A0AAE3XTZ6_9BACT|nr:DUF389 domain-containing protein [Aureibacter tunicatorum]MDR6241846.1 putative hydrophobic protein (TIGR00271 family) [Aureibacter tunicatorum]BDD07093.1 membrane protein [Aureibacter tunicatorum]